MNLTRLLVVSGVLIAPPAWAQIPEASTLATVNGRSISAEEVDASLGQPLRRLQEQMYTLKRQRLEALIAEQLLADEARRRGITVPALIDAEVTAKVTLVSESEIEAFCRDNGEVCQPTDGTDLETRRSGVRTQLQMQKLAAARGAFLDSLRAKANVQVYLTPPPVFRADVSNGVLPVRGAADAPVTIVEFSDFHCPFCRRVEPTLRRLLEKYPTQIRLVYRDIPLDRAHPEARRAAEAARCANDQGKFWEFHDQIYAGPTDSSVETLRTFAQKATLDVARFEQCVQGSTFKAAVQSDVQYAGSLGVTATPTFFVNGRMMVGAQPYDAFVRIIEDELALGREQRRSAAQ